MELKPIGIIHSPYKKASDAPRQGKMSELRSEIDVHEEYGEALLGIEKLSHIIVLYWGDRADREVLVSSSPWRSEPAGVFSIRSPNRPNPLAFCVCQLIERRGNTLVVTGLDALDGSPLLDIKAYSASIDSYPDAGRAEK